MGKSLDPRSEPWREPVRGGYPDPALFALPGMEQIRALVDGRTPAPPINYLFGLQPTEAGPGTVTFTMPVSPWLQSPQGTITAGTLSILADGPLGCAVQTVLPPSTAYTTSELSLRVLRPARVGMLLTARGRVVHAGRQLALSEVRVEDAEGHLVAHGSSLCRVFPPRTPFALPRGGGSPREGAYTTPHPYLRPAVGEVIPQQVWDRMSGLEVLRAMLVGELPAPPLHHLTGLRLIEAAPGEAAFALPASEWFCPPSARLEGGVTAMLADAALSGAMMTVTPAGTALASIDLKVDFLRPVNPDGRELVARGTVAHAGRTVTVARSAVTNADGKLVALATGSALRLSGGEA